MSPIWRRLSPWCLAFLLSGALLAVLWVGLAWREQVQRQQARVAWEQEAREALATLRTTHTLESQIDGMGFAMAKVLSRHVARHPGRPLTGGMVVAAWRRFFPPSHRLPGSRLFAFACGPDGRARSLTAEGLADRGGRVMADLFGAFARFANQGRIPASLAPRVGRLTKGVFGTDAEPGILAVHRRGRTSPVTIDGRRGRLFWEIIGSPSQPAGGFFLLLPDASHLANLPLGWCLERVAGQARGRLLPVLLPAGRFRLHLPPLWPGGRFVRPTGRADVRVAPQRPFPLPVLPSHCWHRLTTPEGPDTHRPFSPFPVSPALSKCLASRQRLV